MDPIFDSFSNLAIHESVLRELVTGVSLEYVNGKISNTPSLLKVFSDSDLSLIESQIYTTYIDKIAVHTKYLPERDNKKDRGEVLSLAYMAVKGFSYFASNDGLVKRLIEKANKLKTGLENVSFLSFYDILYFLQQKRCYDNKGLRSLYKYLYFLTELERKKNPNWVDFVNAMEDLYC